MKIIFYDFDGTLINSPMPLIGKIEWENYYGKPYPHNGWWSKNESLDIDVFDIGVNEHMKKVYYNNSNGVNIILTNRLEKLSDSIKRVIKEKSDFIFDLYSFKMRNNKTKIERIIDIISLYEDIDEIEFYDDDISHFDDCEKLDEYGVDYKCYHVVNLVPELVKYKTNNMLNKQKFEEEKKIKFAYSAVVLDEKSHNYLLEKFNNIIPDNWKKIAHHMTIKLGLIDDNMKDEIGKKITLKVKSIAKNDRVIACGVDGYKSFNEKPHITLAVNVNKGAKPKESNDLEEWIPIKSFQVTGVVEEVKFY